MTPSRDMRKPIRRHITRSLLMVAIVFSLATHVAVEAVTNPVTTDLYAWYDAGFDVNNGTAGTGDTITLWGDQSGNGRPLDRVVNAGSTFVGNALNGLPVARYTNGANWSASSDFGNVSQPNTVFIVGSVNVATNGYLFDSSSGAGRNALLAGQSSNPNDYQAFAGSVLTGGPIGLNNTQVHAVTFDGASSTYHIDGQEVAAGDAGSQSLAGFIVGARFSGGSRLNGDVAEVLVYNAALSANDRAAVENYLSKKYDLPTDPVFDDVYAWYKGNTGVQSGGLPAADGDPVDLWRDVSGNNRHLDRVSGPGNPIFNTSDPLNGNPTVQFNNDAIIWDASGSGDFGTLSQPNTIIVVGKVESLAGDYLFDSSSGAGRNALFAGQSSNLDDWQAFAGSVLEGPPITLDEFQIHQVVFDGTDSRYFLNRLLAAEGDVGSQSLAGLVLGGRFSVSQLLDGEIAEVLVFDRALGDDELAEARDYLRAKYAIDPVPEPVTGSLIIVASAALIGRRRRVRPRDRA